MLRVLTMTLVVIIIIIIAAGHEMNVVILPFDIFGVRMKVCFRKVLCDDEHIREQLNGSVERRTVAMRAAVE